MGSLLLACPELLVWLAITRQLCIYEHRASVGGGFFFVGIPVALP